MSDGDRSAGPRRGVISAEDRRSIKARASEIDRRLDQARARTASPQGPDAAQRGKALSQGFKIAIDLIAGVAFGAFVGWWLDGYLGTKPWLMILFIILGFSAGMMNVIRTARRLQAGVEAQQRAAPSVRGDADEDD